MSLESETIVSENMKAIIEAVDEIVQELTGEKLGISIFIYNPRVGGRINYISNVRREEVITAIKSMIKGWEDGMPDIPAHEIS